MRSCAISVWLRASPRRGRPKRLPNTKFSAGWGIYYDAIRLELITRHQDQINLSTFYSPDGSVRGPVPTVFLVNEQNLRTPFSRTASFSIEQKLPGDFYLKSGYMRRTGDRGFTFTPLAPQVADSFDSGAAFQLANSRRDRYDSWDVSLRHISPGRYEWFAGYTRSSARSNAAVDFTLENPIFAVQGPGSVCVGYTKPLPYVGMGAAAESLSAARAPLFTRNTTAAYLLEYRTGFPFGVVNEEGFLIGPPNSVRFPDYFNINLHLERQFRALHYLWAWRFGFNNLTNNGNPNAVNNVLGTPNFLGYARGQSRAFSVRLRLLGRK